MAWLFNQAKRAILDDVCKVKKQVEISISKRYEWAGPAADSGDLTSDLTGDLTGVGGATALWRTKEKLKSIPGGSLTHL